MSPHSRVTWRKFLILALAFSVTVSLSGCSGSPEPAPPVPTPPSSATLPTAKVAPVFASDEQAVTAATLAYAAYSEQAAALFSTPDSDPELIRTVVSEAFADLLIAEAQHIRESGLHIAGEHSFDGVRLRSVDESAVAGSGVVVVELCLDASGASRSGQSLPARTPYLVSFDWQNSASPGRLIVGYQRPLPRSTECG